MTRKPNSVVVISVGGLKALALDPEKVQKAAQGLAGVDEVRLIGAWDEALRSGGPGDRVFAVGFGPPTAGAWPEETLIPVDLSPITWIREGRREAVLAAIESAVREADLEVAVDCEPFEPFPRVLVLGTGTPARQAVKACLGLEANVTWVDPEDGEETVSIDPRLERISGFDLQGLDGFAGRFSARITPKGHGPYQDAREIQVGAVWITGREHRASSVDVGPCSSETLSRFFGRLSQDDLPDWAEQKEFKAVFLAGRDGATSTGAMERIFRAALWTTRKTRARVFILAPQIKVAEPDLERLYGEVREAGVTFFRTGSREMGQDWMDDGQWSVFDSVAWANVRIKPDLVVLEDPLFPDPWLAALAGKIKLFLGPDGFLSPDNALYLPSGTNRKGVFALGPARGGDSPLELGIQIMGAEAETRELFSRSILKAPAVVVDEKMCAHCLSCLQICPQEAILFTKRPWPDGAACVSCGLCAARCPAKVLTLPGFSDAQAEVRLKTLLGWPRPEPWRPRLVMFGCRRSAVAALRLAPSPEEDVDFSLVPLPCGGRLDDRLVLRAFLEGADGVMISVCHEDNCRTQIGPGLAHQRFASLWGLLGTVGTDPERLSIVSLAPNTGVELSRAVSEFRDRIQTKGPIRGES